MKSARANFKTMESNFLRIALPEIFGSLGLMIFDLAHLFWASHIGTAALAGIGSAGAFEWVLLSVMGITHLGCRAMIAQLTEAKKPGRVAILIEDAIWLTLTLGTLLAFVVWFLCPYLFRSVGLSPQATLQAVAYFRVWLLASPVLYLFVLTGSLFIGFGETKASNAILTGCLALTLILDPFLMFGWMGLPNLGIQGAAVSAGLSYALGLALRIRELHARGYLKRFPRLNRKSKSMSGEILRIGIPLSATGLAWAVVYPLLTPIIARFGMPTLAAVNIGHGLENVAYYLGVGLTAGATVLSAKAWENRDPAQLENVIKISLRLANRCAIPTSVAFIFFPGFLMELVTHDSSVVQAGIPYLRITGYFEMFMLWEQVLQGVLCGIGRTPAVFWICFPLTFARIPLAHFLAIECGLGDVGIWWAVSLTTLLKGVALYVYLKTITSPEVNLAKLF